MKYSNRAEAALVMHRSMACLLLALFCGLSSVAYGAENRATGVGHPSRRHPQPQARLMAQRAAEVRAVRALGMAQNGERSFYIRDFRYSEYRTMPDGRVVVTVTVVRTN